MFGFLTEQPNSNPHYLNRLIKLLNHFISIEPPKKTKGYESHHIVPKSWKPEWKKIKDTLLKVPAKAHYVIHHLMWKAFPSDCAMQRSFWYFVGKNKTSAKTYSILKQQISMALSKSKTGKPSHNKRQKVGSSFRTRKTGNQ